MNEEISISICGALRSGSYLRRPGSRATLPRTVVGNLSGQSRHGSGEARTCPTPLSVSLCVYVRARARARARVCVCVLTHRQRVQ